LSWRAVRVTFVLLAMCIFALARAADSMLVPPRQRQHSMILSWSARRFLNLVSRAFIDMTERQSRMITVHRLSIVEVDEPRPC
jgi:hypothetical protein